MELLITVLGLPLLFVGYKIGLGKMLYRDRWYKSFFFWYVRLGSIAGVSMNFQKHDYFLALPFFLLAGVMWANTFEMIYKKIMSIKEGITEPFKGKDIDEINEEKISDLEEQIKNTRKRYSYK